MHVASKPMKIPVAAILATGSVAMLGLSYILYRILSGKTTNSDSEPRDFALKVLKELRKELCPVFKEVMTASQYLKKKQRSQTLWERQREQSLRQSTGDILEEFPELKVKMSNVEDKVYRKNLIRDQKTFEELCKKLQKTDPEVGAVMKEIQNLFSQAKRGEMPTYSFQVPKQISETNVLKAQREINFESMKSLLRETKRYREDEDSWHETDIIERNNAIEEFMDLIFRRYEFDVLEDFYPESVFQQAVVQFSRENSEFRRKYQLLEKLFEKIAIKITRESYSLEDVQREVEEIDRLLFPSSVRKRLSLAQESRENSMTPPGTSELAIASKGHSTTGSLYSPTVDSNKDSPKANHTESESYLVGLGGLEQSDRNCKEEEKSGTH